VEAGLNTTVLPATKRAACGGGWGPAASASGKLNGGNHAQRRTDQGTLDVLFIRSKRAKLRLKAVMVFDLNTRSTRSDR